MDRKRIISFLLAMLFIVNLLPLPQNVVYAQSGASLRIDGEYKYLTTEPQGSIGSGSYSYDKESNILTFDSIQVDAKSSWALSVFRADIKFVGENTIKGKKGGLYVNSSSLISGEKGASLNINSTDYGFTIDGDGNTEIKDLDLKVRSQFGSISILSDTTLSGSTSIDAQVEGLGEQASGSVLTTLDNIVIFKNSGTVILRNKGNGQAMSAGSTRYGGQIIFDKSGPITFQTDNTRYPAVTKTKTATFKYIERMAVDESDRPLEWETDLINNDKYGSNFVKIVPFVQTYTVTFATDGGSAIKAQTIEKDGKANRPETDPTKEGFTFEGWYADKELTKAFNFDSLITKDTTVYAKWEEDSKVFTVTFDTDGGSEIEAQTVEKDAKVERPETDPTKEGFTFEGWYADKELTKAFNFDSLITKDTTIYAKWEEDPKAFTVTFATDGGSEIEAQTVDKDGKAMRPETDPTKEGFTFEGWYGDKERTKAFDFDTVITEDTTIYAKWEEDSEEDGIQIERIAGEDRMKTAVALSKENYEEAEHVVLARADDYPDALTASVFAATLDAPILLTYSDRINAEVQAEIERLDPTVVWVIGGTTAIEAETAQVYAKGRAITRVGGEDRYETAGLVADKVTEFAGEKGLAMIATGANYPDALAISPVAARLRAPILLVRKAGLPDITEAALTRNNITKTLIIGGEDVISETIAEALPEVEKRLAGKDRYETAHAIAREYHSETELVFLATGLDFPDALAAGPMAAKAEAPLLLAPATELRATTKAYLEEAGVKKMIVVGGSSVVSEEILEDLK